MTGVLVARVAGETMNSKRKAVLDRIESLQEAIRRAREHLESGKHAYWHGFRPLFGRKADLPPHQDWVRNVFLRGAERALARAERVLERLGEQERVREPCNATDPAHGWRPAGSSA